MSVKSEAVAYTLARITKGHDVGCTMLGNCTIDWHKQSKKFIEELDLEYGFVVIDRKELTDLRDKAWRYEDLKD